MQESYIQDYLYSTGQEISQVSQAIFKSLIKEKVYKLNSSFNQNQKCMYRLTSLITQMQFNKENLKIIKELIRYYFIPVLFFLRPFYEKIDKRDQKQIQKNIKALNEIHSTYKKIFQVLCKNEVQYFSFIKKYGTSTLELPDLAIKDSQYQKQYLSRYSESLNSYKDIQMAFNFDTGDLINLSRSLQSKTKLIQEAIKQNPRVIFEKIMIERICRNIENSIQQSISASDTIPNPINLSQINFADNSTDTFKEIPNVKKKKFILKQDIIKQIKETNNEFLCCRSYFYEKQEIIEPQNQHLQYKNYRYPYDKYCIDNLRKTICGFLNRSGGTILIGIREASNKEKYVRGQIISENMKEQILRQFRQISEGIFPNIISTSKYSVKFIPIMKLTKQYIPGKYILRIKIRVGNDKQLYCFKEQDDPKQLVAIRTTNQVLKRQINQQVLSMFKQKLLHPIDHNFIHEGQCKQPEKGIPINYQMDYQDSDEQFYRKQKQQHQRTKKVKYIQKQKQPHSTLYANDYPQIHFTGSTKHPPKIPQKNEQQEIRKRNLQRLLNQIDGTKQKRIDFHGLNWGTSKKDHFSDKIPGNEKISYPQNVVRSNPVPVKKQEKVWTLKPLNKSQNYEQFLIVGIPYKDVRLQVVIHKVPLTQDPIKCHHELCTWIKVRITDTDIKQKFQNFKRQILRISELAGTNKKLKIRKVQKMVEFSDEVTQLKMSKKCRCIRNFKHRGICYFEFQSEYEAIQAYLLAWEMGTKIKFISLQNFRKKREEFQSSKN